MFTEDDLRTAYTNGAIVALIVSKTMEPIRNEIYANLDAGKINEADAKMLFTTMGDKMFDLITGKFDITLDSLEHKVVASV